MSIRNIYGTLPVELQMQSQGATQYSPLIPRALSLEDCEVGSLGDMTMHAPAGTLERRYALALALRALAPRALMTVLAEKDKGGKRLKEELLNFGCDVNEESRRHFRICQTSRPEKCDGLESALEQGGPRFVQNIQLWSQPGIFSWDRLDIGSKLLVEHLPTLAGRGADLGCGIGYLTCAVLVSPDVQNINLIDIDHRAVACAKRNIPDQRASFYWSDIRSMADDIHHLDFIVMNPPFHNIGVQDHSLGQQFIEKAHGLLRSDGTCWLTANRHLPYEGVLKRLFKTVKLKIEDGGYKIYEAVK